MRDAAGRICLLDGWFSLRFAWTRLDLDRPRAYRARQPEPAAIGCQAWLRLRLSTYSMPALPVCTPPSYTGSPYGLNLQWRLPGGHIPSCDGRGSMPCSPHPVYRLVRLGSLVPVLVEALYSVGWYPTPSGIFQPISWSRVPTVQDKTPPSRILQEP